MPMVAPMFENPAVIISVSMEGGIMFRTICLILGTCIPMSCASHVNFYDVDRAASDAGSSQENSVEDFTVLYESDRLWACAVKARMEPGDTLKSARIRLEDLNILPCVMTAGHSPATLEMSFYNTGLESFVLPLDSVTIGSRETEGTRFSPYITSVKRYSSPEGVQAVLDKALQSQNPFPESAEGWDSYPVEDKRVVIGAHERLHICFTFQTAVKGKRGIELQFDVIEAESKEPVHYSLGMEYAMRRLRFVY